MAKINDEMADYRNKRALESMVKALEYNEKYTFDSSIIQQWIIKSCKKSLKMQKLLRENPTYLKYLT